MIVAIQEYNEPKDFKTVDYAEKDALDFKNAMLNLGYDESNFTVLINHKASKTAIDEKFNKITSLATKNDRIIFYFAGHGFYINEENVLAPADAIKTSLKNTCIPIDLLLGYLKKSSSKKNILFFDCCHSGFQAGKSDREVDDSFEADELEYKYRDEEYCVGFASCKSDEKSYSDVNLKNGIWTHFLIKALSAETGSNIYQDGILFSDKLQNYICDETKSYVKLNTISKNDQTPIRFGSETGKFIIADLNPIFKKKKNEVSSLKFSIKSVTMESEQFGAVKSLPGFKSGHHVPNYFSDTTDNFIKQVGNKIIIDEIEKITLKLKEMLNYKRKQLIVEKNIGKISIVTPDFDYNIEIMHLEETPNQFMILRKLENFKNSDIIENINFSKIFDKNFDNLKFELSNKVNIEKLIDIIEKNENSDVKVIYNSTDFSKCKICLKGFEGELIVYENSVSIFSSKRINPKELLKLFSKLHKEIIKHNELKMLLP